MIAIAALGTLGVFLAGCASTSEKAPEASAAGAGGLATRYKADDGRTIEIGRSSPANGGLTFKEPHMDKCWIADGFNFTGYDALYKFGDALVALFCPGRRSCSGRDQRLAGLPA